MPEVLNMMSQLLERPSLKHLNFAQTKKKLQKLGSSGNTLLETLIKYLNVKNKYKEGWI